MDELAMHFAEMGLIDSQLLGKEIGSEHLTACGSTSGRSASPIVGRNTCRRSRLLRG